MAILSLQKKPLVSPEKRMGGPVWTLWRRDKSSVPARNQITIPQLSSLQPSHYTYYAILTPPLRLNVHVTFHSLNIQEVM